uniref:CNNM transmembrane domain-containing protein n=1 Tax=Heterorhabditis bacteriophora TaxID=37862 RepID=A0A1I7X8P0_HETBA
MSLGTIVEEGRQQRRPVKMSEKLSKCIIEARCTDNVLFSGAAAMGTVVLILQSFPVVMNNWVFLTEPRPINKTNENGEQMVLLIVLIVIGKIQKCGV